MQPASKRRGEVGNKENKRKKHSFHEMWHVNSDHLSQASMQEEGQGNCNYSHNSQVQILLRVNTSSSAPS